MAIGLEPPASRRAPSADAPVVVRAGRRFWILISTLLGITAMLGLDLVQRLLHLEVDWQPAQTIALAIGLALVLYAVLLRLRAVWAPLAVATEDHLKVTPAWGPSLRLPAGAVRQVVRMDDSLIAIDADDAIAAAGGPRWARRAARARRDGGFPLLLQGPFREGASSIVRALSQRLRSHPEIARETGPEGIRQRRLGRNPRSLDRWIASMKALALPGVIAFSIAFSGFHPLRLFDNPVRTHGMGLAPQMRHLLPAAPVQRWGGVAFSGDQLLAFVERGGAGEPPQPAWLTAPVAPIWPLPGNLREHGDHEFTGTAEGGASAAVQSLGYHSLRAVQFADAPAHASRPASARVEVHLDGGEGARLEWDYQVAPERRRRDPTFTYDPASWLYQGPEWGGDPPPVRLGRDGAGAPRLAVGAPRADGGRASVLAALEAHIPGGNPFEHPAEGSVRLASERPYFGRALDLANGHLAVGFSGGAAVYRLDGSEAHEVFSIEAEALNASAALGAVLALSPDGRFLALSDHQDADGELDSRVLVFDTRQSGGTALLDRTWFWYWKEGVDPNGKRFERPPADPGNLPALAFAGSHLVVVLPRQNRLALFSAPEFSPHAAWYPDGIDPHLPVTELVSNPLEPGDVVVSGLTLWQVPFYFPSTRDRSTWFGARLAVNENGRRLAVALPGIHRKPWNIEPPSNGVVLLLTLPADGSDAGRH